MNKRRFSGIAAVAVLALFAAACGGGHETAVVPTPGLTPNVTAVSSPAGVTGTPGSAGGTPSPTPAEFTERIAFVGADGNVWIISSEGTGSRRLTTEGDNAQPSWSPSGEQLAYIHARQEVHLVRADGSQHSVVSQFQIQESCGEVIGFLVSGAWLTRVVFTPDSSGIRLGLDWGGVLNQFICHIPVGESAAGLPVVSAADQFGINPIDGSLAYTRSGQGCADILIADPNGEGEQQIGPTMGSGCTIEPEQLSGYPYAPAWSPDGERIAFYGFAEAGGKIYVMDSQGATPPQPIVSVSSPPDLQWGHVGLSWSPDGKRIAYEDGGGIWIVGSDGTGSPVKVTDGHNPSWGRVPAYLRVEVGTGWLRTAVPSPSPPPSPVATASPEAVSTPAPTLEPSIVPQAPNVSFVPAEAPLFTGEESGDPFGGFWDGPTVWRAYIVRGDEQPELIYETNRWLAGLEWSPDGRTVIAPFQSGAAGGEPYLSGTMFLDVASPTVTTSELLMQNHLYYLSPDGSQLALEAWPAEGRDASDVYVTDRKRHARKLEGLGEKVHLIGWLPDGSGLLVYTAGWTTGEWAPLYLVPLAGGPATLVAPKSVQYYSTSWSPEGTRLAYLSNGDLHVFDTTTGESHPITSSAKYGHSPSHSYMTPRWSVDGSEIILEGDLIDLATGDVVASLVPPEAFIDSALSPDGRYFAAREVCDQQSLQSRIRLYDREANDTRILRDCDEGVGRLKWLPDGHHLLVEVPQCWACEPVSWSVSSMDVETGDVMALTDGLEPHAAAYPSPDGDRVLVTGKTLRLYTDDGQLLRALTVPEGFDVAAAAWSVDGSAFAYIIGPAGFIFM